MFSLSIDHLENGRQVGWELEEDCWLTNLLSASLLSRAKERMPISSFFRGYPDSGDVCKAMYVRLLTDGVHLVTDSFWGEKQILGFLTDLCSRLL